MPRRLRIDLAGFPLHVIQRGNNRSACFASDIDRGLYLRWLGKYAAHYGVAVHAWVLMTNHVHLLLTPPSPGAASRHMQSLGRQYVGHFNHVHERTGTLWEGRFRACAVHAEAYLLTCMRYIELNPVRAGIADWPEDHRWSSFRSNALGQFDQLLTPHPLYTTLGDSPSARQFAYRELFHAEQDDDALDAIRNATCSGHVLVPENLRKELENDVGRCLGPALRGRPKRLEVA